MFLEQPAHSMWELRWAKRTLPSKYWAPALSSLVLCLITEVHKEVAAIVAARLLLQLQDPPPLGPAPAS